MGSTTVPHELRQISQKRKPWIIVLTETKLTDAWQDRVFFQEHLPEYTLLHSLRGGTQCRKRANPEAMYLCTSELILQCGTAGEARLVQYTPVRRASRARRRATGRSNICHSFERFAAAREAVSLFQ